MPGDRVSAGYRRGVSFHASGENDESSEPDETATDREQAELLYKLACNDFGKVADRLMEAKPAEYDATPSAEWLLSAQVGLLQAVYHELRHGQDRQAEHTAALKAHTKAPNEHANQMHHLGRKVTGNSDALDRSHRR